jgi:hypothetical protein
VTGDALEIDFVDGVDDLEPRKLYQLLPDATAARVGHVRVIDESGKAYLYPAA